MKNILSIDWDFFMKVSDKERMMLFPDGGNENLPPFLHEIIWSGRYAAAPSNVERSLEGIGVCSAEIKKVVDFAIKYTKPGSQIVVAESHLQIAPLMKEGQWGTVMNIDFHHDCFDLEGKGPDEHGDVIINCGNWARVFGNYGFYERLLWISREESQEGGLELDDYLLEGIHYIDISIALTHWISS